MIKKNAPVSGWKLLGRIIVGSIVGALLFTAIGVLIPHTYTATSVLLFPGAKSGGGGGDTSAGGAAGAGGNSSDQPALPLMEGVLSVPQPGTSPSTAALILNRRQTTVDLIQRFGLNKEWRLPTEKAIERFHEYFQCSEGKSGDLRISYTDRTPQRAQELIATAIDLLTRSVEDFSERTATKNVAFVRDSLKQSEANCARIQEEIVRLQRKGGGTTPDAQLQTLGQILGDLQKELTTAEVQASVAASSMKATTDVSEKIVRAAQDPTSTGNALITSLYKDVAQRETELALLREKYTDRRSEVVQARQALAAARRSLEAEIEHQVSSVQNGASPLVKDALIAAITSRAQVDGLRQSAKVIREKLEGLPAAQMKYSQLTADLRDERARVSLLRSEYLRAQLIVQSRGPQFVMLDPPTLPKRPNGYELYYFAGGGALLGLLAVCLMAMSNWIKRSMKDMKM